MSPETVNPEELSRLSIRLERTLHNQFKAAVAAEGKSIQDVLVAFIEQYVSERRPARPQRGSRK